MLVIFNDILGIFIPNYFDLIKSMQFVHDFGAPEDFLPRDVPEIATQRLQALMESPISVQESDTVLRAATRMTRHNVIDLPVINAEGKLVGLLSHVDIGIKFLEQWLEAREEPLK